MQYVKIYTKTGDKGETGLIGGKRTSKSNPRIIAYGTIDELNSNIGLVISVLNKINRNMFLDLVDVLVKVQNDLFIIGSDLADPTPFVEKNEHRPLVIEDMASYLECIIDNFESELSPIKFFILPGGSIESSLLHVSRSITRRAETMVAALSKTETINPATLIYLNRLSDLLFVGARLANKRVGMKDVPWRSNKG